MKDFSLSIKVGDAYKTVANLKQGKYGPQFSFSPEGRAVILEWLKKPQAEWLNLNLKEWDNNPETQTTSSQQTSAPKTAAELDDEIPF